MKSFKLRAAATEYLRSKGVPLATRALDNMASAGTGPKYSIVRGRALYAEVDLDEWLLEQLQRPTRPEQRRAALETSHRGAMAGSGT